MATRQSKLKRVVTDDDDGDEGSAEGYVGEIGGYEHPKSGKLVSVTVHHGEPPKPPKGKGDGMLMTSPPHSTVHVTKKMARALKLGDKVKVSLEKCY